MRRKRIEIEEVKNGFQVEYWSDEEETDSDGDVMYPSPEKFNAKSMEEVTEILAKKFKGVKND